MIPVVAITLDAAATPGDLALVRAVVAFGLVAIVICIMALIVSDWGDDR